jgi:hypothetical protein
MSNVVDKHIRSLFRVRGCCHPVRIEECIRVTSDGVYQTRLTGTWGTLTGIIFDATSLSRRIYSDQFPGVRCHDHKAPAVATPAPSTIDAAHLHRRLPTAEKDIVEQWLHILTIDKISAWECLGTNCRRVFERQSEAHKHVRKEHLGELKLFECLTW